MAGNVILVGDDSAILMDLAVGLRGTAHTVTVAESSHPLARAMQLAAYRPTAMLVTLDGHENVVDVRTLLASSPETRFAFIVPQMPPRAPLARVVREHGGAIVSGADAPVVIMATFVALLAEAGRASRTA
jgi:hypothetical protein